jgi:thioredoxin 1
MKEQQRMKDKTKCGTFTEINFQDEVIRSEQPVLAVFEASWSGTCDIMTPIMENLCIEFRDRVKIGIIDIDGNRKLADDYSIITIPALIFFNRGEIVDHVIGLVPKYVITKKLNQMVSSNNR